jgi:AraC family transcriptional regulator
MRSPRPAAEHPALRSDDLALTEIAYAPDDVLPSRDHAGPVFYVVLDGVIVEETRAASFRLGVLDASFHPPGGGHRRVVGSNGARCLVLEMSASWFRAVERRFPVHSAHIVIPHRGGFDLALRLNREFERGDALAPLAIEGLALELLAFVSRHDEHSERLAQPAWLRRLRAVLAERYTEDLALSDLARECGVHRVHMAQTFRRHFGLTIGEYVRRRRLQRATLLLRTTDLPVSVISASCGFYDQSHFTRLFRRHRGVTPARFRMQKVTARGPARAGLAERP